MKILELCTSDGVGGLELYVARTVDALRRLDCNVLAAVRPGTMLQQRLEEKQLPYVELPRRSRVLPLLAARYLARIIEHREIDLVHMHWGHDLFLAALAKRLSKRPVKLVYTRQMALTRSKKDFYHRLLYGQIDLYLTITDKLAEQARGFLPLRPDQVQRLYYGVASRDSVTNEQHAALRKAMHIPEGAFAVGLVGRIESQKGQHVLLDAARMLRDGGHPIHVSIIGPAMNEAYLDQLKRMTVEWKLEPWVHFHGPHKSPMSIMPAFDVVVLTTRMETFGLVLAEAMRCGVAVIGTDAGGVPEIIEHGVSGLLFPPENSVTLAERLKKLIVDPSLRTQLAAAGKARADDLFAEETHYRSLMSFFEATAATGSAG